MSSLPKAQPTSSPYLQQFARVSLLPSLAITVVSCLLLASCGQQAGAQGPGGKPGGPMPVPVVEATLSDLPVQFEYPAQVSGFKEVEIRARVSGIIERRLFEEGARVKAGQSLYALDSAPYDTALTRALADEKAAAVRVDQTRRDLQRIQPLLASKAVAQSEVDNAQSALDTAEANLAVAKARVKEAKLNVTYAKVESPVTGVVGRSLKSEGSLVAGPQDLLTAVTQVDKVYVNFGIPEADHLRIKQGQASGNLVLPKNGQMQVEVLAGQGKSPVQKSVLAFQDVRVNPATGTVDARAVLDNAKNELSPGQFVRVRLSGAIQKNAMVLPQRAVLQNPMGGKIVMTVGADGKVAPRPVEVAQWSGDQWVVTGGLQAGDKVMTDGFIKAPPGTPVQAVPAGAEPAKVAPPAGAAPKADADAKPSQPAAKP